MRAAASETLDAAASRRAAPTGLGNHEEWFGDQTSARMARNLRHASAARECSPLALPISGDVFAASARVTLTGGWTLRLDGDMTDSRTKPEVDAPEGPAPDSLVIKDLIVGDGVEATPGANVTVHYLGVSYDSGEEFDSSWGRGETISFPLRGLIQGWQDGIPGMKVGGRRQLTIPPELAYGKAGSGHFLAGQTLVFIIDLYGVG